MRRRAQTAPSWSGRRSIGSTRVYLHLANDWLAVEYRRAVEAIDAQDLPES